MKLLTLASCHSSIEIIVADKKLGSVELVHSSTELQQNLDNCIGKSGKNEASHRHATLCMLLSKRGQTAQSSGAIVHFKARA
ncbi:hypothetical protein OMCYN_00957 [cyanobiont of Ornithocercus magnificus]|nr:hypothetical protein OMCYN_00957 [cyanobiont of Ornithocercus magnificus]